MKRLFGGLAATALFLAPQWTAAAQGADAADLWIGIENSDSGFLLDTQTGDAWMTGSCLKPIARARNVGSAWISDTSEMVSVGRMETLLQQTFRLDVSPVAPSIVVENLARGGAQTFDNVVLVRCDAGACRDLGSAPAC